MDSTKKSNNYRDLAIYIVKNLYQSLQNKGYFVIEPYEFEDQLLNEFKLEFYSISNEYIYSLSYKLLMEMEKNNYQVNIQLGKITGNLLNKRNLFIFLEYLIDILEKDEKSYSNELIKLNILILLLFFSKNDCKKLVTSNGYFNICINELKKLFPNIGYKNESIFDKDMIEDYISIKKINFLNAFKFLNQNNKKMEDDDIPKIGQIIKQVKSNEINNENIDNYIKKNDRYLGIYIQEYFKICNLYPNEDEINTFKRILFYLEDLDQIACYLGIGLKSINYIKEFKEKYEPVCISQEKEEDFTNDLKNIIESDEFENKLKEILQSNIVQNYLKKKRRFNDITDDTNMEYYNFSFIDDKDEMDNTLDDEDKNIDNLQKEYELFMKYYDKKGWLKSIINYKYLPNGIRGFVNQTMLIVVNPLFIKQSNLLKNNGNIKRKILFAYLIILFVHEIIHLLKFLKKIKFEKIEELPSTPKMKEGGKMFINYLFGKPVIKKIDEKQANQIINVSNWNDLENLQLKLIFLNENENEEITGDKNSDKEIYISFYSTNLKKDEEEDNQDCRCFTKY